MGLQRQSRCLQFRITKHLLTSLRRAPAFAVNGRCRLLHASFDQDWRYHFDVEANIEMQESRRARRSHVPTIKTCWSGPSGVGRNSAMISRARARAHCAEAYGPARR